MEVATIDWNDSKFEKDELYEHINAPQWIDFSANQSPLPEDDAWFCRPDCNHPQSADDFFSRTAPNRSKICTKSQESTSAKKRGTPLKKTLRSTKHVHDSENQNPNFYTPVNHNIKSRSEKKKQADNNSSSLKEETPRKLKSTFSARNLFAGNNILNQITEFCNDLKRLASRKKEKGDELGEKKPEVEVLQEREIQKKPLQSKA